MKTNVKIFGSSFVAALLAASTFGQNENEGDGIDVLSPFNVIGTKADVPKLQGSGAVLDSSDLKPFFHTDINEILRQVPGVYVRPEEGYGFFPNISLRGVDPNRSFKVTIMEDGIPSSPAPFADPSAYYAPTAGRMAGFEILKGSSQLKHGPNTTGGVINYLSTPIPNDHRSHLHASYGEFNERIAHAFSGGKTDLGAGKLGYLVEVFDHRSDGWKTLESFNGAPLRDSPIAKTDITFKLSYEFKGGDYLEFKAGRTDLDADVSYQGLSEADFKANPYHRYAGTEADNMDSDQSRFYLRYKKDFTESLSMTTTGFYNEFNRNWLKLADVNDTATYDAEVLAGGDRKKVGYFKVNGSVSASDAAVGVLSGTRNGKYKVKSNDRSYSTKGIQFNFDYEVGNNDFDLGFRYTDDNYIKNPYHEDVYTVDANNSVSKKVGAKSATDPYKDAQAFEIYLTDSIDLGNLNVTPGVRYTSIDYQYKGANDRTLDDFLVGVGAGYQLSENTVLYGGVHQGHAFPDAESASSDDEDGLRGIEESLSFEVGLRGTVGKVYYDLAYFNTGLEDMLVLSGLNNGVEDSANIGEASSQGLEVLLGSDLGGDAIGVPLSVSATFTDTEYEGSSAGTTGYLSGATSGTEFPYVPDFTLNLRGGLVFEKFSTYLNYHHQAEVFTNGANTSKLDSYGILDWSGFYAISDGVTVFGKVTNLADKEYAHSLLPDGCRAGAPRICSVGMSFDF